MIYEGFWRVYDWGLNVNYSGSYTGTTPAEVRSKLRRRAKACYRTLDSGVIRWHEKRWGEAEYELRLEDHWELGSLDPKTGKWDTAEADLTE